MDTSKEKEKIRKEYLQIRENISNKDEKSDLIFKKIIQLEEYKNAKTIALYKNLKNEVSTSKLIEESLKLNKKVVLPRVVQDDLIFYQIHSLTDPFKKSSFGVLEPQNSNLIDKHTIDLVITPGVCFDKEKNRLGFGKGYYDRFLNTISVKTIGICFEEQIIKKKFLPKNEYDYQLDKIVTDKKIY